MICIDSIRILPVRNIVSISSLSLAPGLLVPATQRRKIPVPNLPPGLPCWSHGHWREPKTILLPVRQKQVPPLPAAHVVAGRRGSGRGGGPVPVPHLGAVPGIPRGHRRLDGSQPASWSTHRGLCGQGMVQIPVFFLLPQLKLQTWFLEIWVWRAASEVSFQSLFLMSHFKNICLDTTANQTPGAISYQQELSALTSMTWILRRKADILVMQENVTS